MAHSSSKVYPHVAQKEFASLDWYIPPLNFALGSQKVCTVGMAPASSKFQPRLDHKRYASLNWHNPPPQLGHKRYAPLDWHVPPLNFTLRWLTKGLHRWRYIPPLSFTLGWLTKGMHRGIGACLIQISPSAGSQRYQVCIVGLAHSSSEFYPRVPHKKYAPWEWQQPHLNFSLGWVTKGMRR